MNPKPHGPWCWLCKYCMFKCSSNHTSLVGQLLIADPHNPPDDASHSVIMITNHTVTHTQGLILNQRLPALTMADVAQGLDLHAPRHMSLMPIMWGGPHAIHRVSVLHSLDWQGMTTVNLQDSIGITMDLSVISAMVAHEGPHEVRACAGSMVWTNQDLEQELCNQGTRRWELVPADRHLVFGQQSHSQWQQCLDSALRHRVSQWI